MTRKTNTPLRSVLWAEKSEEEAEAVLKFALPEEMHSLVGDPRVKFIPLTKNGFAVVDTEDFEELAKFNWWLSRNGYAVRKEWFQGRSRYVFMHRSVLRIKSGHADHINTIRFDNRTSNLREATRTQNIRNRRKLVEASSKFKGVTWNKQQKLWRATISGYLGDFESEIEAALCYDKAAKFLHAEFARTNEMLFPGFSKGFQVTK